MPEIGSDAWLDAFNRAVADLDAGDATTVSVAHHIVDGPAWVVRIEQGRVSAGRQQGVDPEIVFTWQRDDAEAVARGELSALAPFQAGRLRVGGDLSRLVEVAGVFARFPAMRG